MFVCCKIMKYFVDNLIATNIINPDKNVNPLNKSQLSIKLYAIVPSNVYFIMSKSKSKSTSILLLRFFNSWFKASVKF